MAITYTSNLVIYTGTDFEQTFELEDDQTSSALNLTGYNGCAQLKKYESSSKAANFTISFSNNRATGKVSISIAATVSAEIKPGKYFYDLLLKNAAGTTTRVVEGTALVKKSVTR
jgi:hypothetical protein